MGMDFNTYQTEAFTYKRYPNEHKLWYPVLGLCGEVGEIAENYKKLLRSKKEVDLEFKGKILLELGDVLWYMASICGELDLTLEQVAKANLAKQASRKREGKNHSTEAAIAEELLSV